MKNNISNRFKFSKIYFITIIIFIFVSLVYLYNQYTILKAHQDYIYELQVEIQKEKQLNKELKNQKEYKNSDEYIEKIAREKLGMLKSNEIIFYNTNK